MKYALFDLSNLLYRTFFANKQLDVEESTGLAHHTALMSMNKFYKQFNPDRVIVALDRPSWRKDYTKSDECISGKLYKGNRRQKMTPAEQKKFARFMKHVGEFEEILREHTSIICLAAEGLEADDLIAGFVQAYGWDTDDEIVIISRDRDLTQLQGNGKDEFYPNVIQYDPQTDKNITIETAIRDLLKIKDTTELPDELNNVDYFMFAKCIRGDTGDYVQSAYPGIRKTRIEKAYLDPFEKVNLLNESWKDNNEKEFLVNDLFNEGMHLMNLQKQPGYIRKKIFETILEGIDNPGSFSYFHFMKWLGKYQMKEISDKLDQYTKLLSS